MIKKIYPIHIAGLITHRWSRFHDSLNRHINSLRPVISKLVQARHRVIYHQWNHRRQKKHPLRVSSPDSLLRFRIKFGIPDVMTLVRLAKDVFCASISTVVNCNSAVSVLNKIEARCRYKFNSKTELWIWGWYSQGILCLLATMVSSVIYDTMPRRLDHLGPPDRVEASLIVYSCYDKEWCCVQAILLHTY